ncbi:hypothetical protein [Rhodococcus sp. 4CII]|uniref:hypothetical protein n=1 Tax=Rhodococcus sp. 4CII TaxID=2834580 RepID=UPI00163D7B5A|nr:hypothetical protein [Rhodococcus sp. 4CII]MBC2894493.1 hypothetical protein [Rhodococcus sp. 4CII]
MSADMADASTRFRRGEYVVPVAAEVSAIAVLRIDEQYGSITPLVARGTRGSGNTPVQQLRPGPIRTHPRTQQT